MLYRNTRTGAVIEAEAVIVGGDWEAAGDKPAASMPKVPAQKKEQDKKPASKRTKK